MNGDDNTVFYIMTPIETDEDVKSMFQCHITLSQLPTIEIYVRLVENLEEQPSHNENLEEQPTHNENLSYPTQSIQSHKYGMSQAIDEEPTQNNEPFISNEEVGENNEDDLEEVRFEDLFGVSDDDDNEDIFDTPTVALRVQPISLYNPHVHMQNISLDDAEPNSVFGSFIPTHNADEIEEGIEYENKEECVMALQQWHIKRSLDFSVVKSDNVWDTVDKKSNDAASYVHLSSVTIDWKFATSLLLDNTGGEGVGLVFEIRPWTLQVLGDVGGGFGAFTEGERCG
ncbi:hypothetical protein KIW84_050615 [Lathyrus oleraceus]|uniref:Uncharacterized protein n=1 Tax=Pisum sativum TaxID=3888 RepID=A0A9D4WJ03_PEA|nr:hypothetical protein KIW84_050615 [Pisum sativum]